MITFPLGEIIFAAAVILLMAYLAAYVGIHWLKTWLRGPRQEDR